ncbi:hypothetical protein [Acanthopleuribacter pedis]|uniref:Uncharacterized protein n=1 Tax=Acanthopleuribacter pedis TaxID=442870 RepID=A0A8J7QD35_9BACT|nr:hypothetical protein [Acanthopleuribacter pedis]MBO1317375.1 hypothetical protein [Acanthopleuribacter pedis]MBO1318682.1 hypothetical protein [Acanthopleuribacter pedis]
MIEELDVDETAGKVRWRFQGKRVEAESANALNGSALYFETGGFVGVMNGVKRDTHHVDCFDPRDGRLMFQVKAPEGFSISYLANHPDAAAAVVCGADEKVDGWYDWHFAIDPKNGSLKRISPAY